MKKSLAVLALMGAVGLSNAAVVENPILKKLVEKGILTEQEAAVIDEQLAKEEAEKAKYQAEIDKTAMEARDKIGKLEKKVEPGIKAKFKTFEIRGTAYIGYTFTDTKKAYTGNNDRGDFEVRRFYFDTRAYLNDKDYIRFTTDIFQENNINPQNNTISPNQSSLKLRLKYAFLYKDISKFIPYTGFELGLVHKPWIAFEEKTAWFYRSVDRVFIESSNGIGLWPSADYGIDFITKTPYISSEIGMYSGEGYNRINTSSTRSSGIHNSFEGRITYHIFGDGNKKVDPTKDQYANITLHLASNIGFNDRFTTHKNLNLYLIHAVYNHPMFLIAGQYGKVDYNSLSEFAGKGWSANFEIRPVKDWSIFGRYDYWKPERAQGTLTGANAAYWDKKQAYYVGVAYTWNKNVKWILNYERFDRSGRDNLANTAQSASSFDRTNYKLTAELSW